MKIFCYNHEPEWILGRITEEFCATTSHTITNDIQKCDAIFLIAPFCYDQYHKEILKQKKFIVMLHHISEDKFDYSKFVECDQYVDTYIVPNCYTKAFVSNYTNKDIQQICYWINPTLWSEQASKKLIRESLEIACKEGKLDHTLSNNIDLQNAFIVGSFVRDTEGEGISQGIYVPKHEKGPLLFVRCIEHIQNDIDNVIVLLSGWRRQYIIQELTKRNIPYIYVMRPILPVINALYDALNLYVVSSRCEGGPQHLLEAPFKKIPTISRSIGIVHDILHTDCIMNVEDQYIIPAQEHIDFAYKKTLEVTIDKQVAKIDNVLEKICS